MQLSFVLSLLALPLLGVTGSQEQQNDTARDVLAEGRKLMFPRMTTLQITLCTVTNGRLFFPKKKYPARRVGINLGFQLNYNMPYRLLDFYKPATWARSVIGIVQGHFLPTTVVKARDYRRSVPVKTTAQRFSAGQLYSLMEDALETFGYGKDCLARSVCELAHSPLHRTDKEDLLADVVHFLLSPSVHDSFAEDEKLSKTTFEMAERLGASGADCELVYHRCGRSVLGEFSNFIEETDTSNSSEYDV